MRIGKKIMKRNNFKGNHTCKATVADKPDVVDTTEEMLSLSRSRAISELHLSAARIWYLLNKERMSKEAIVNVISNTRRDQGCGDIYRQVESSISDCDPRLFLKKWVPVPLSSPSSIMVTSRFNVLSTLPSSSSIFGCNIQKCTKAF
ncbi:hypothetical protein HZS_7785 [Henneguya salminicola]|nr:hypothetical protein HZS_7785 [Henneguya salminicola]